MKKKLFLLIAALMAIGQNAFAYDFSAVAPSGQTLYYTIIDPVNHYVKVTYPNDALIGDEPWFDPRSAIDSWGTNPLPMGALVLPDTVLFNETNYILRAVGSYAFSGCPITSVVMPNTVDSIGGCAFQNCTYLLSVTFSNSLRFIGPYALSGCYLGDVVLPPSVQWIEYGALRSSNITNITLNDSIQHLGEGCLEDNPFTSLFIPASVNDISGIYGTAGICSGGSLTSIVVDPNNPYFDSRNNCNAIIDNMGVVVQGCNTSIIPEGVLEIGRHAFSGCNFNTFVVPSTVINISYDNFLHCNKMILNSTQLLYGPNGATYITFWDTLQLTSEVPPVVLQPAYDAEFFEMPVIVPCNSLAAYQASNYWSLFTNMYALNTPQITVNAEHGTATVETYPTCGNDTATVSATASEEHYHFVRWSDGSTQNPYTLALNGNTTLTAIFAIDSVLVRATPANPLKGAVMGGSVVPLNGTTTLTAIPLGSNIFLTSSNGVTDNPYTLTATSDTTLQAYFTLPDTLIFRDTINHYIHDTTFINNYVHDTTIQYVNQYIHDTTYINNYIHDTTILYMNQYVHDTTYINNYIHDTIRMTTQMFDTTIVNVYQFDTAIYNTYHFDTTIIHNQYYDTIFVHLHDTIYITQEGIDGVDGINAKVYSSHGQVVVEGADGNMVTLYDVNGRVLATKQDYGVPVRFDAPVSATYIIKIGNYPARKVVVIR